MGLKDRISSWIKNRGGGKEEIDVNINQSNTNPTNQNQQNNSGPSRLRRMGDVGKTALVGAAGFGVGVAAAGAKSFLPSTGYDALFIIGLIANIADLWLFGNSVNTITIFIDTFFLIWVLVSLMKINFKSIMIGLVMVFMLFFVDSFSFLSRTPLLPYIYLAGLFGITFYFSKLEDPDAGMLFAFFAVEVFSVKLAVMLPIIKPVIGFYLVNKLVFPLWSLFAMYKGSNETDSGFNKWAIVLYIFVVLIYAIPAGSKLVDWQQSADQIISQDQQITVKQRWIETLDRFKTLLSYPGLLASAFGQCYMQMPEPNCTRLNQMTGTYNGSEEVVTPTGQDIPIIPTTVTMILDKDGNIYPSNMIQTLGLPIEISITKGTDDFVIPGGRIECTIVNRTGDVLTGIISEPGGPTMEFNADQKQGNSKITRLCRSKDRLPPGDYRLNVTFTFDQQTYSYLKMYFIRAGLPDVRGESDAFPYKGKVMESQMKKGLIQIDINSKNEAPISIMKEEDSPLFLKLLFIKNGEGFLSDVKSINLETPPQIDKKSAIIDKADLTVRIKDMQQSNQIPTQEIPLKVIKNTMFIDSNNPEELRIDVNMEYSYSINKVARFKISKETGAT